METLDLRLLIHLLLRRESQFRRSRIGTALLRERRRHALIVFNGWTSLRTLALGQATVYPREIIVVLGERAYFCEFGHVIKRSWPPFNELLLQRSLRPCRQAHFHDLGLYLLDRRPALSARPNHVVGVGYCKPVALGLLVAILNDNSSSQQLLLALCFSGRNLATGRAVLH